jgi:hypothetical protein
VAGSSTEAIASLFFPFFPFFFLFFFVFLLLSDGLFVGGEEDPRQRRVSEDACCAGWEMGD